MNDKYSQKNKKSYKTFTLPENFSDEEMARDWTLSRRDSQMVNRYRKEFRLGIATQLCAMRLYGRFLTNLTDLSPKVVSYLSSQLTLPPTINIRVPDREATIIDQRNKILNYLEFKKYNKKSESTLAKWIKKNAATGALPDDLFSRAETYLLVNRIVLPGQSTIERLVIHICNEVHAKLFESFFKKMSKNLRSEIDDLLERDNGKQVTYFNRLKEYPPSAKIGSLQQYLDSYDRLVSTGINNFDENLINPALLNYLYRLTRRYSAHDIKRFNDHKRYALMVCFLLESRKYLLDNLVKMHDQYITEICRESRNSLEKKHKEIRKTNKQAIDVLLTIADLVVEWPEDKPIFKKDLWSKVDQSKFTSSVINLQSYKRLEERGYCDLLIKRYPSLRKYFSRFLLLPFEVAKGSGRLLKAIEIVRQLDSGQLKKLPSNVPTGFIPKELMPSLKDQAGNINRNIWEIGLALAMKDALRSRDLYLPQSRQFVSFWDLTLSNSNWNEQQEVAYQELEQPLPHEARYFLSSKYHESLSKAKGLFDGDNFAEIM